MLKKLYILKKKTSNHEEGFTLLELMIVIVIIGILAAIAILVFANQQKSAIEAGVKSDTVNARSVIPATPHGVKEPEKFASEVTITEGNLGRYFVNQTQSEACYDVSNTTDTETFVYRYATNIGKIETTSCDDWVTNNPGGSSVSIESTPTGPETTSPAVTIPTPSNGNASGGGEFNGSDYGSTTDPYLLAIGGNYNHDYYQYKYEDGFTWRPYYTTYEEGHGRVVEATMYVKLKPKGPNNLSSWSVTWQEPNITGILSIQSSDISCSVATGGIITCTNNGPQTLNVLTETWERYQGQNLSRYVVFSTTDRPTDDITFYIATESA